MKFFFALFVLLDTAASAQAEQLTYDYDNFLTTQRTIEVTGISKAGRAYGGTATQVCASMGYARVVSAVREPCTAGEALYFRKAEGAAVSELRSNTAGNVVCGSSYFSDRLVSVVCAK